ncbi:MAG: hypothetical protein HQ553_16375 [Chloroflexi bacterium]|nr:hypothetical protein [Chloroflexota bacterium]
MLTLEELILTTDTADVLHQVEAKMREHFVIDDWEGVRIILGIAVAHYAPGEMLWVRLPGASRSGKTEILRPLSNHQDGAKMEAITPAAIRGGLVNGARILDRIDGKLVITKDISALLTTRRDARNEIFGLLRSVKDGELVADFGIENGHVHQRARFDWICATTPVFEQYRQMESLLGERFIDIRWRAGDRQEMAFRAGLNNAQLTCIRSEVEAEVHLLMDTAKLEIHNITLNERDVRIISQYADKTATLRTPVQRDRQRNLIAPPHPEIGTDLTQGLCRIVTGLKLLCVNWEPYMNRFVWDGMPETRAKIMECLVEGITNTSDIAFQANISTTTVDIIIQDLKLLGVIDNNRQLTMQLHNRW